MTNFSCDYEVKILTEFSSDHKNVYYFPGGNREGGKDGLIVEVNPRLGKSWTGVFSGGFPASQVKQVFPCPDPHQICVVVSGFGHIGDVRLPGQIVTLPIKPLMIVKPVPEANIILFANFTQIFAWGVDGLLWQSQRVSSDGLQINKVDANWVWGSGWDAPQDKSIDFKLDLRTGEEV